MEMLQQLLRGESFSREQAMEALELVVTNKLNVEQSALFLTALKMKGETVDEIAGFADCLTAQGVRVTCSRDDLVDVCGTGGDASGTFNVSTTVAFVLAGAGQPVAKHGNRSVSSRSGSFDLLEALGIPFCSDPAQVNESIHAHGLAFLFAPSFHPILKNLSAVRKNLGVSTVMNILGPLLNPVVEVKKQVLGVYAPELVDKLARVLLARGTTSAMVVHGAGRLDEFSLSGPTFVTQIIQGDLKNYEVDPEALGFDLAPYEALRGGSPEDNAGILLNILMGEESPRRDIVLLNASAALVVSGKARDFKEGIEQAADSIDSGAAFRVVRGMQ